MHDHIMKFKDVFDPRLEKILGELALGEDE